MTKKQSVLDDLFAQARGLPMTYHSVNGSDRAS